VLRLVVNDVKGVVRVVEREKVVEAELLRRVLGETLERAGWVDGVGWDWEAGIGEEREVSVGLVLLFS
jgi:hypothetical protein